MEVGVFQDPSFRQPIPPFIYSQTSSRLCMLGSMVNESDLAEDDNGS